MSLAKRVKGRVSAPGRAVLSISAGTAAGQIALVAASPLLTRLYSPEDFGTLAVIIALATTLVPVASLRLELAVPLPREEDEAQSLAGAALLSTLVTTLVVAGVAALVTGPVADLMGNPQLADLLWTVPLVAGVTASYLVLNQLAIRHQRYGAVGRRNLISSLTTVAVQLTAGLSPLRGSGLILGLGAGQLAGALSLLSRSGLCAAGRRGALTRARMSRAVASYRRFPLLLAPAGLLNALGLQLPVILMSAFYGAEVAGWFGLTQRILALPVTLIGVAVAQVYLGELSQHVRDSRGSPLQLFDSTSKRLGLVGVVGAVLLVALAPPTFGLIFGDTWSPSGDYAQALAFGLAAQLVASPLSQTLIVLGRTGTQLTWDAARLLAVLSAIAITAMSGGGAVAAMWALGLAQLASYSVGWALSRHAIGAHQPNGG